MEDYQDIVAIIQRERGHKPTAISIQEIAAGRLPQGKTANETERQKAFDAAIQKFYKETEE